MTVASAMLINGEPGERVCAHDRGFQYGDGLFETLAVARGVPLLWERHLRRLLHGAARLGIGVAAETGAVLRAEADQLCQGAERAVLKIILTRGVSGRGYAPSADALPTRVVSLSPWADSLSRTQGVSVKFCDTTVARNRALAGVKHLNRLEQILARRELETNYDEGLMQDETGHVIEGTMSNVFIVARGELLTPDLSYSGVAGVMRELVLERAPALSLACRVTTLTREEILNAEEVFLTNSLIGLWSVTRIESKTYWPGPVTQRLRALIQEARGVV
ncbi:MAG: aminodeoxychorismate lyase [Bacteroidota bacterium]